jgi:hypothetical protein
LEIPQWMFDPGDLFRIANSLRRVEGFIDAPWAPEYADADRLVYSQKQFADLEPRDTWRPMSGHRLRHLRRKKGENHVSTITVKDGTTIYCKDWGSGQPIVFSHGWPLSADDWDTQMLFFLKEGYRVIAHDRRGHGRSSQSGVGHDMDHYADDLAALTAHLDLKDAIHVGHSTGGGEVVHYLGRHGEGRVGGNRREIRCR